MFYHERIKKWGSHLNKVAAAGSSHDALIHSFLKFGSCRCDQGEQGSEGHSTDHIRNNKAHQEITERDAKLKDINTAIEKEADGCITYIHLPIL